MSSKATVRTEEWKGLEREVFERVRAGMACNGESRKPTIVFLRHLEHVARKETARRQTIQIIASGRRLLGDRSNVEPFDGRFLVTHEDDN